MIWVSKTHSSCADSLDLVFAFTLIPPHFCAFVRLFVCLLMLSLNNNHHECFEWLLLFCLNLTLSLPRFCPLCMRVYVDDCVYECVPHTCTRTHSSTKHQHNVISYTISVYFISYLRLGTCLFHYGYYMHTICFIFVVAVAVVIFIVVVIVYYDIALISKYQRKLSLKFFPWQLSETISRATTETITISSSIRLALNNRQN